MAQTFAAWIELQWGHVFSDVETRKSSSAEGFAAMLQWGHVFSDVETPRIFPWPESRSVASMGPRLFRRGNGTMPAL